MLLNRTETRLNFSYFGLLIPRYITKVQSQIVSNCLNIFRAKKKKCTRIFGSKCFIKYFSEKEFQNEKKAFQ